MTTPAITAIENAARHQMINGALKVVDRGQVASSVHNQIISPSNRTAATPDATRFGVHIRIKNGRMTHARNSVIRKSMTGLSYGNGKIGYVILCGR